MDVRPVPAHISPARDLIEAMVAELVPLYGRIDGPDAPTATPEDFAAPHGTFIVLFDSGGPVAGGGVKRLDEQVGEIKRMYVVPQARGRGHGRTLLEALEHEARQLGYTHVRLDTGIQQPNAQALYESAGYVSIEDYNGNPHASYWGEKPLS
jgi:GNAT superfamily N-acetyltransferase